MLEKSYLYQEIHEQPEVLANLLAREVGTIQSLADAIHDRGGVLGREHRMVANGQPRFDLRHHLAKGLRLAVNSRRNPGRLIQVPAEILRQGLWRQEALVRG